MEDHREVLGDRRRSSPRAPSTRVLPVGSRVGEDSVELLPEDDGSARRARSGSSRYGGHSDGTRRSSSQASRARTSSRSQRRIADPALGGRSRRDRQTPALAERSGLQPEAELARGRCRRRSADCRSASPRRAHARSSRARRRRSRMNESLALPADVDLERSSRRHRCCCRRGQRPRSAGRSRCRAATS